MAKEVIALDAEIVRESVRERDRNGFLKVRTSCLTRDQVAPYYGREIPLWQELGLDPEKIYYGWRHPDELRAALPTFNGVPLLIEHKFDSAVNPNTELRVGTVGTSAAWEPPYITNALSVWDEKAIEAIENGSLRDLSCGYRYEPDFTPGKTPDGVEYDFVMRKIACNHVALVRDGRADGCYVEDALPEGMQMTEENKGACDDFSEAVKTAVGEVAGDLPPEKIAAIVAAIAKVFAASKAAAPAAEATPAAEGTDEDVDAPPAPAAEDEDGVAEPEQKAEDEDETEGASDEDDETPEGASDAALKVLKEDLKARYKAAADVKAIIGDVQPLAYDSANDIYLSAIREMGYRKPVNRSAARVVFDALRSIRAVSASPKGAQDSAIDNGGEDFLNKYLNR